MLRLGFNEKPAQAPFPALTQSIVNDGSKITIWCQTVTPRSRSGEGCLGHQSSWEDLWEMCLSSILKDGQLLGHEKADDGVLRVFELSVAYSSFPLPVIPWSDGAQLGSVFAPRDGAWRPSCHCIQLRIWLGLECSPLPLRVAYHLVVQPKLYKHGSCLPRGWKQRAVGLKE